MMAFCKDFNAKTQQYVEDIPIRVKFTAYSNKTFTFTTLGPPTSWFIKQACALEHGAQRPGHENVSTIHAKQLYHAAKCKQEVEPNLQLIPLESIVRSMAASCRSMGVGVDTSARDVPPGTVRKPYRVLGAANRADTVVRRKSKK
uniref:Large ribosomal subunit protein uL11m n=1 Tax=Lygus hesperus TaxID=30085 RepID=A0A0A9W6G3_LYGHE